MQEFAKKESSIKNMDYEPIDYKKWDFSGKGKNISGLLKPLEKKIWEAALPYQDKRDDKGHGEIVTYFSLKLLDEVKKAKRNIVIPAAILHDTGWGEVTKSEINLFYEMEIDSFTGQAIWQRYEPILRARHQEQGVQVAEEILKGLESYSKEETEKILDIISEHDTRKGFLNANDGIMRDADKLFRFSVSCLKLAIRKGRTFEGGKTHYDQSKKWINQKGFFYSNISREIASTELENAEEYLNLP